MSDNLDIRAKITLEADEAASVKQIKSQIPNIEGGLKSTRVKIQVDADATKTAKDIDNAIKEATGSLKTGKNAVIPVDINIRIKEGENSKLRKLLLDVQNLETKLSKSNITLDWSKFNTSLNAGSIKQAREELTILGKTYRNLSTELSSKLPNQAIENLPKRINEAVTSVQTLKNAFNGLKSKGVTIPDEIFTKLGNIKTGLDEIVSAPKNDASLEKFRSLTNQVDILKDSLKEMSSGFRFDNIVKGVVRADVQLKRFQQNMLLLKKDWSAFTKDPELMKQFEALFSASQQPGAAQNLASLNAQLGVFKTNVQLADKAQKGFLGRLAQNFSKFVSWFAIGGFTASAVRGFRDIFAAVKDIDTAMTYLRKVTDETDKTYSRFLTNASKKAVQLGASVSDLVSATTSFARLGYSIEDSYSLGQLATVYANVGDEVNGVEGATSSIISTLAGFKLGVQDATSVVDKFNNVGNNFAITSGGLGEALKRSASALHEAGADIDSSIALITGANTVVQDVDMVGTALKTSSLRLRGSTTELEDMGEDVDEFAKSTSLLRRELEALTGVDIMINDNQYKDIYTVYEEIAKVYDSLTDVSQANVLEILFGKRQAKFA